MYAHWSLSPILGDTFHAGPEPTGGTVEPRKFDMGGHAFQGFVEEIQQLYSHRIASI